VSPSSRLTALAAAVLIASTGCGDDDAGQPTGGGVPESAPYNAADVGFATEMIPHHAEALSMVDLAVTRQVSPGLAAMTEQIRATQAPEIEELTSLLEEWGRPVPENPRDHANAGHDGDGHGTDLEGLEEERGAEFERAWLEMMIDHHGDAVAMAERESAEGEDADAVALAESIVAAQTAEIRQLERLLEETRP
jgi:uncharacterized protein (DUF305 family)